MSGDINVKMQQAVDFLADELATLRTGRANPGLVTDLPVDSYGTNVPLKQVAQVATPDASSLVITPWDKSMLGSIETGIRNSNIGLEPNSDGTSIRLTLPPMTEERRIELTRVVGEKLEAARVALRNIRHEAIADAEKEDLSEDLLKHRKDEATKVLTTYNEKLEALAEAKKEELLRV